jgi:hypothetical protein
MTFRCRDLDPGNNKKSLSRQTVRPLKFLFYEIFMHVTGIMIRYRDTAQAAGPRRLDQLLGAAGCIRRKERMDVKIKSMNHNASLFAFDESAL